MPTPKKYASAAERQHSQTYFGEFYRKMRNHHLKRDDKTNCNYICQSIIEAMAVVKGAGLFLNPFIIVAQLKNESLASVRFNRLENHNTYPLDRSTEKTTVAVNVKNGQAILNQANEQTVNILAASLSDDLTTEDGLRAEAVIATCRWYCQRMSDYPDYPGYCLWEDCQVEMRYFHHAYVILVNPAIGFYEEFEVSRVTGEVSPMPSW